MTALCGGGTSGPQAGVSGVLTLGATAIEGFITGAGYPEVAAILAPIIAGIADITIATYCATDPPADPGLTATDVENALAFPPHAGTFSAQQKILQWFESRYWYDICQCTSVSTPTPPTLSNPGGAVTNPGLPKGNYSPCWNATVSWFVPAYSGTGQFPVADLYGQGLPSGVPILVNWVGAGVGVIPMHAVPIDPGIINQSLTLSVNEAIVGATANVNGGTATWNADGSQFTNNAGNSITAEVAQGQPSPQTTTKAGNANTTTPRWWSLYVQNTDSVAHTGSITLSFTCPPGVTYAGPCCPPDQLLEGELQQILQYVEAIYAAIPVPLTSFAEGVAHAGLSGSGSITFSAVPVAIKVTLTTIPPSLGFAIGDPDYYFDAGFLSFGTSEGNYDQVRVALADQLVTVPVLAGSVGYTLLNGVVATITELLPGP